MLQNLHFLKDCIRKLTDYSPFIKWYSYIFSQPIRLKILSQRWLHCFPPTTYYVVTVLKDIPTWNNTCIPESSVKLSRNRYYVSFSSVQLFSPVQLFATLWTAACQASLSITNFQSLLKLMSIESMMLSNHFILCCPLRLPYSIFPSIRVFSNEWVLWIRWPKYWSFSFSISPSNEFSGLISFKMDWLDLLAVQGTLKSLLRYHSSKPSILWCSAFFIVQLSHPYMTTGKTI